MIYTLTLNPSIDYHMDPLSLNFGQTNRSRAERHTYGGKGINVSVVLHRLGVDTVALGAVGGFTGAEIVRLVEASAPTLSPCRRGIAASTSSWPAVPKRRSTPQAPT